MRHSPGCMQIRVIFNDATKRLARTRKGTLSNAVFLYSNQRQRPYPFVSDNIHTSHNPSRSPLWLGTGESCDTKPPNYPRGAVHRVTPDTFSQKKYHVPPKPTPDPCTMTGSGSQSSFTTGITASEKTPLADRKKKSTRKGFFKQDARKEARAKIERVRKKEDLGKKKIKEGKSKLLKHMPILIKAIA